jgi:ribonuclease-3
MAEEIFGYTFKNRTLLEEALTTPSCKMDRPGVRDNQRLEFLGDSVLGLLSAESLYLSHPGSEEGRLTVKRTQMVSTPALCAAAERSGLRERLRRNRGAAELPSNSKTLADAVEAVMGAAWLDGGMEAAKTVFESLGLSGNADGEERFANPKGELQIRAQAMRPPQLPRYELLSTSGRAHSPVFTVRVSVEGMGTATAAAGSHKAAEAEAAQKLLALSPVQS